MIRNRQYGGSAFGCQPDKHVKDFYEDLELLSWLNEMGREGWQLVKLSTVPASGLGFLRDVYAYVGLFMREEK